MGCYLWVALPRQASHSWRSTTLVEMPIDPAGRKRVTIDHVARAAGVSRTTVSKVFNDQAGISQETMERVRRVAAELGWAPSSSAAALASANTRNVAIVFRRNPDLLTIDPHFSVVISGVEDVLAPRGYGLQLYMVGEEEKAELDAYRDLSRRRLVDGVLMSESRVGDKRYDLVASLGLPAVLMGYPEDDRLIPAVHAEVGDTGLTQAAQHLVEFGHRRIAYVSGPPDRVHTGYRRSVFVSELARLGVGLGWSITTSFTEDAAASAALSLMGERRPPTVIVFANDSMAMAAIGALQRHGYNVPADISVVGHDDLPFGHWAHPRLTTISQDLHQMARVSALRLLQLLGTDTSQLPSIRSPQLIVRDSTAPPP